MYDKTDVKNSVNILELVERYGVKLRKVGSVWQGLCPFHKEDTPSFTVYPDTRSFYCFGFGEGGDVIDFVQLADNVSFAEAIGRLGSTTALNRSKMLSELPHAKTPAKISQPLFAKEGSSSL